jgi:hypothetical protein
MEPKRIKQVVAIGICLGVVLLAFNSCSKKIYFTTSPVVPAARGYVKIKKDNNDNYTIEVNISNLAEVERLQGNKKAYVVWMIANNDRPKNIGQINSDTKRFSKQLTASFQSVTGAKPARIFITAETDAAVHQPESVEVLTTEIL